MWAACSETVAGTVAGSAAGSWGRAPGSWAARWSSWEPEPALWSRQVPWGRTGPALASDSLHDLNKSRLNSSKKIIQLTIQYIFFYRFLVSSCLKFISSSCYI